MSTRRSMRLRAKEDEKREREKALKVRSKGGRVRRQQLLDSDSDDELPRSVSEGQSTDSSETEDRELVVTPVQTPSRRRVNNFTKVYNSYNKDDGIDCYERDFIDDRQLVHDDRDLKGKKMRQKRRRQRSQIGGHDSEGDSTSSGEEGVSKPLRRSLQGSHRKPRVRGSSEEESEGNPCNSIRANGRRAGKLGRGRRCSDGSEEGEEPVRPTRGKRRKRSLQLFDSGDDSESGQQEDFTAVPQSGRSKKKRFKQLESDDEISLELTTPTRPRSSRAQKLNQDKERKTKGMLRKLQAERAKQKGGDIADHSDAALSSGSSENDNCRGDAEGGEDEVKPDLDPAKLLEKILFTDSGSSEEESDWIVSDFEDYMPNPNSRLPFEEDADELESEWKGKMSIKSIFRTVHDTELWCDNPNGDPAMDNGDLSALIYAAGCTDTETFKSLLPRTDIHAVASALEAKETSLLHVLIEAPLLDMPTTTAEQLESSYEHTAACADKNTNSEKTSTSTCQSQAAPLPKEVDKDSASLSCLQALSDHNNNRLCYSPIVDSLLKASSKRHPSALAMAVWHGRPKCVSFLLNSGASPFSCGLVETNAPSDILEFSSPCSDHTSSPPPSLLHLALLGRERDGEGEKGKSVQLLEQLLPTLETELELTDAQGYTPLMHAADIGDTGALRLLLRHGASINCKDPGGTTPLHLAALSGWVGCVEVLVANGHPVDCRDEKGWPPLLYAHFGDHQECVLTIMKKKPGQLSVISELLKRAPEDGSDGRIRTVKVVRSLLVSLAHHDAYYSLFNSFISQNLGLLEEKGFGFMKHCMALLSFDNKQAWLKSKLKRLKEHGHTLTMSSGQYSLSLRDIPREGVVDSAYSLLCNSTPAQCWLRPLDVTFKNEPGICTGPRKEFWSCLSRALASGEEHLFVACDDGQLSLQPCAVFAKYCQPLTPNAVSTHMEKLQVIGMLLAQAVFHGDTLDFNLTKPLIKQLMGCPLNHPADLEAIDKSFYHCLTTWLEGGDIDDLELTFTCTLQSPWDDQSLELPLQEGGRSTLVREANKDEYVSQMSRFKLEGSLQDELEAFCNGFWKVIPKRCLQVFMPDELSLILSGVPTIDVNDWQRNTEYQGLQPSDDIVVWFWCLVVSLKEEEKALLLKFCTGSPRVPTGGFAKLQGLGGPTKFKILLIPGMNKIPQAATCFNTLKLTSYSCEQDLRDKTLIAIRYGCEGFEFS